LAPETLISGLDNVKDADDTSTDNGSSNGDHGGQIDPAGVLAAREKSIISNAMATLRNVSLENGTDSEDEEMVTLSGAPVLEAHLVPFKLATPSPHPSHLNIHYICETASRLLFLSVHWVRSIPVFSQLNYDTQVALVRNAWSDLFILGMAQCSASMNLSNILSTIVSHLQTSVQQEKLTAQRVRLVTTTICKVQEYVKVMTRLAIDEKEFALLKLTALFSTDHIGITSPRHVVKICHKVVTELKEHCSTKGEDRFTELLLRLSPLRSLQPDVLEELFFAGLIGNVQIDSVVPYILKMENSEYQASQKETKSTSEDDSIEETST